jgi:hypothetical protein
MFYGLLCVKREEVDEVSLMCFWRAASDLPDSELLVLNSTEFVSADSHMAQEKDQ